MYIGGGLAMHITEIENDQRTSNRTVQSGQRIRKYRRVLSSDLVGDLVDGQKIIGGIVENISPGGFEITNLPKSFAAEKHIYTTVLSGGGKHYKILARPRWRKKKGEYHIDMGFKILDAPWQWLKLTLPKQL